MPPTIASWWTDEKVEQTCTSAYVHSHLHASEQEVLGRPPYYGGDLTDNTYLDWILSRAKRFFLILVATGIPDQIFGILDDCLDDEDLPIAEQTVPGLHLSQEPDLTLDKRFYKTQFKYLTRIIADGEHIRYAAEENVPITSVGLKSVIPSINKDGVDIVRLPDGSDKVFVRRKVTIDSKMSEEKVLSEIAEMKKFSHEHVISVYGSYLQDAVMAVLSYPAAEYTLKSFLTDTPKVFEAMDKPKRRKILMNWTHCLANALAFLHHNGGHHGAIRPSNIHITHQWHISLGPLDGEGVLCSSVKHDDLESYQFAPPERWKRAVTVQNTGSGKVSLPSGGRSARKVPQDENDPLDPSSRKRSGSPSGGKAAALAAYAFLPASKSEFARFRLSTTIDSTALIQPPTTRVRPAAPGGLKPTSSRGMTRTPTDWTALARAPSALSSNSSEGRNRNKGSNLEGIFLATPESRTAVVQTWKSVQHDSFAADVFSLAAVLLEILTVLSKKTCGAFARHRSAKNRNAGRGGGLADASFHANLGQVMSWAQLLAAEAEKKAKKDESHVLSAVGAVLQVTVQCLERNPESRLKSDVLEKRLGDLIKKFANIDPLHCTFVPVEQPRQVAQAPAPLEPSPMPSTSMRANRSRSRPREESIPEDAELESRPSTRMSTGFRPATSRFYVPAGSPPTVSLGSLTSPSLDIDNRSEPSERSGTVMGSTMVGSYNPSRDHSVRTYRLERDREARDRDIQAWAASDFSPEKPEPFDYLQRNDSETDPHLRLSTDNNEGGIFTYMNYSTSASDDDEPSHFMYPMPPPPRRPPTRDLPPVPSKSEVNTSKPQVQTALPSRARKTKSPPPNIPRGPSREDMQVLQKLSRAVPGSRHPMRMSSLNTGNFEDEDDQNLVPPRFKHIQRSSSPHKAHHESHRERVYRTRV